MIHELTVATRNREQMIDVTARVQEIVAKAPEESGMVICFVPHTTAGITINENADPDVKSDILSALREKFPQSGRYAHAEGNSDAHIKASLMGFSTPVLFENRSLVLGRWQAIFFCEFDGPRSRRLIVKVVPHA
jgi:secondary thiamine-phosphate synthase enzyme